MQFTISVASSLSSSLSGAKTGDRGSTMRDSSKDSFGGGGRCLFIRWVSFLFWGK